LQQLKIVQRHIFGFKYVAGCQRVSMNQAEKIKGRPHHHAQPRLLLGCGMLSLAGLGLPLASKGSYDVSILMLADYYRLSFSNALPLLLGMLAPLSVWLAIRDARGAFEDVAAWCFVLGLSGLAISSLGYFEGVHHIRIFGSSCMPQARENDPLARAGIGWGAVLHMAAYAAMTASGMQGMLRQESRACQATGQGAAQLSTEKQGGDEHDS
jgi:hypothetical protein